MKRVYEGNDAVFNLTLYGYPFDINKIKSAELKFYTVNPNDYILKTEKDIVDGVLRIPWVDLEKLTEGVLLYDYKIVDNNTYINKNLSSDYYIVTGSQIDLPRDGEDGATFTPNVSADGILSWTNDKNLPNPESINIKGQDGKDGKDGFKAGTGVNSEIFNDYENNIAKGKYSHAEGTGTQALAFITHAEGQNTTATGKYSHSEGNATHALGESSHAEGVNTLAKGIGSHAEGFGTQANDFRSHAEGQNTQANNSASHSEGNQTYANGEYSHAEGSGTYAIGNNSHTEGFTTLANGINSHAEGNATVTSNDGEHAEGKYNLSNSTTISSIGIGNDSRTRMNAVEVSKTGQVWVKDINEFDGTNPTDLNTLQNALSKKQDTLVSSTNIKTINGESILGSGDVKISGGGVGQVDATEGETYHGEIFNDYAKNKATGVSSHAEGWGTEASGSVSHAEGDNTTASGNDSHAEGNSTVASGDYSHAEGYMTNATGWASHAEGGGASATNYYTHAEGFNSKSQGFYSHAEGMYTVADNYAQHSQGQYNVKDSAASVVNYDPTKPLFVIGNGLDENSRSDAFRVLGNGKTYISGIGDFNGTNPTETNSLQAVISSKQDSGDYALKSEIPSNTSDLNNDSGFLTEIPANVVTSEILADKAYLNASELETQLATKDYATKSDLTTKQDTLVSSTNIKTINGESILGSGNISIPISGGNIPDVSGPTGPTDSHIKIINHGTDEDGVLKANELHTWKYPSTRVKIFTPTDETGDIYRIQFTTPELETMKFYLTPSPEIIFPTQFNNGFNSNTTYQFDIMNGIASLRSEVLLSDRHSLPVPPLPPAPDPDTPIGGDNLIINGDFSTPYSYSDDPSGYPGVNTPNRTWVSNNQGNLMFIDNTTPEDPSSNALLVEAPGCAMNTWYSNYICYRFNNILTPGIYKFQFDAIYAPADGCPDKQITIYWRGMKDLATGGACRIPLSEFITTDQKMNGTRFIVNLSSEWTTYTSEWDFNYATNQFYAVGPDQKDLQPIGDHINDLYLAIMPSSSVSFYIDNVKLIKVK